MLATINLQVSLKKMAKWEESGTRTRDRYHFGVSLHARRKHVNLYTNPSGGAAERGSLGQASRTDLYQAWRLSGTYYEWRSRLCWLRRGRECEDNLSLLTITTLNTNCPLVITLIYCS